MRRASDGQKAGCGLVSVSVRGAIVAFTEKRAPDPLAGERRPPLPVLPAVGSGRGCGRRRKQAFAADACCTWALLRATGALLLRPTQLGSLHHAHDDDDVGCSVNRV
jgi:hypothetical protein